jgi:hypothetical protein
MSDPSSFRPSKSTQRQPLREFNVGAPAEPLQQNTEQFQETFTQQQPTQEMSLEEMEQYVRQAREDKFAPPKISAPGKKRIELLANIGRLTKDITIGETIFSLRTLKSKEMRECTFSTFQATNNQLDASYEARKQQLARAISHIDHQEIDFILGGKLLQDRLDFLDELEEVVISTLWDELIKLKLEATNQFGLKTEKDTLEVVEDLKK